MDVNENMAPVHLHIDELELHGLEPGAGPVLVRALREALTVELGSAPLVEGNLHVGQLELLAPATAGPRQLGTSLGTTLARRLQR